MSFLIVTQALFAAAQATVARRASWGRSHAKYDYLLRGLLTCGRDRRNLLGRKWYGRGDGRGHLNRPIYYCEHCPPGQRPIIEGSLIGLGVDDLARAISNIYLQQRRIGGLA